MSARNRAHFQTGLARSAVHLTIADRHRARLEVVRSLERLAAGVPLDTDTDRLVAAVVWAAAEDPDVIEAIRNLGSVFALEEPSALVTEPRG